MPSLNQPVLLISLAASIVLALLLGWIVGHLRAQRRIHELQADNAKLTTTLEMERQLTSERQQAFDKAKQELADTFSALSSQALKHNSEEFLKLAQENLKQFQVHAQGELGQKEKAIENLVKPIKESLEKTEQQIRRIEKERQESYGSITRHLESVAHTQQLLQGETRNLVQALRRPEVRGQWGEMTLKRLVELSGMVEHCDFVSQVHTRTDNGALRPDMIVYLPAEREVVVDVKTPLDAYLNAVESNDDPQRTQYLQKHAQNLRSRVRELAGKAYWTQFDNSPDFVVLFIPGDQFLSAALDIDPNLLEDALAQKIILATPTSLVALLRAVAYGWQQQRLADNAEQIKQLGTDLYNRLTAFSNHFAKLGKHLDSTIENYNRAVGSFERQVIPGARKFTELGISAKKTAESPETVEQTARALGGLGEKAE